MEKLLFNLDPVYIQFILIAVALWTIPWKGYALWKAARAGSKWWFIALLLINTLAILEILYIFVFSKKYRGSTSIHRAVGQSRASDTKAEESSISQDKREKILHFLTKHGKITNNDVQGLFGISDATATRYLDELEKDESIAQEGEVGRGVFYVVKTEQKNGS